MSKYIGTPVVSLSTDTVDVTGDITTTDATPEVIIVNDTHEDTEGGREGKVTFKGQQSGGEETTLAQIQASHDGTSDDEKGDLIFKTNDGSDGASPTERLRIDSAGSIIPATLGNDNVHLGESALASVASGAGQNTGIGANAGTSITTGDYNTLLGYNAGDALTTGSSNVAVGYNALSAEDGDGSNIAIGANALGNQNAGATAYNVAVGHDAGASVTTGIYNTLIGGLSGDALTDGSYNVGVGYSLTADTRGSKSVGVGSHTLINQNFTSATDAHNTAVGYQAGKEVTTGQYNTAIGSMSLDANTTASYNTAVGYNALTANTTGTGNVAVGVALGANTTANDNTAMGNGALATTQTGASNTAIGRNALTSATGDGNVALGYGAGANATTTDHSTLIGYEVGGSAAMTGHDNTYIGMRAGKNTTAGQENVAIGREALETDDVGSGCVAVGNHSLELQNAAGSTANGYYNVAVGYGASMESTTGYYNTCVGAFSGDDLTTGNFNVFIGNDSTSASGSDGNQICIGYNVDSIGGNYTTFGNNSIGRVYNQYSSNASWTRTSDERIKKDIQTNTDLGLDFVNDLRTVTYKWKAPSEHPEEFKSYNADQTEAAYTEKMYGFIAQEVKAAIDTHNITGFNGWHVTSESQGSQQGISYEMFVMPLVKAVQELSAKVTTLETQNTTQATQIADLITRVETLEGE